MITPYNIDTPEDAVKDCLKLIEREANVAYNNAQRFVGESRNELASLWRDTYFTLNNVRTLIQIRYQFTDEESY